MENKLSTLTASEWIIVLGIVNKYKYTILKLMKDDGGELERLRKEADGPTLDGETPPGILLIHSFHNIWYAMYHLKRKIWDSLGIKYPYLD